VLPLVKPGQAATAVLAFLWAWNDFIVTLVLSTGRRRRRFHWDSASSSASSASIGPNDRRRSTDARRSLVFVFVAERYLVRGLTAGGVKE